MSTDNRTNKLTEAQVEAAAKAMWERIQRKNDPAWGDLDYGVKEEYRKDARAALVAAQGAAPQAESNDLIAKTFSEIHGGLRSFSHAEVKQIVYPLIDALRAPVLPSSGVDEDKLVQVLEVHRYKGMGWCECGENVNVRDGHRRHVARVVAEWLKGQRGDNHGE